MRHRRLLATLLTLTAAFAVALAVPLAPATHAAGPAAGTRSPAAPLPHTVPPGARPYGGSGSTSPMCTQWHIVSSPQPSGAISWDLQGVSAVAANDVWAVGDNTQSSGVAQTLVEHFDGSSWSIVASPNVAGATDSSLSRVVALASNNVWAVGNDGNGGVSSSTRTLVEHYDGSSWSIVSSPNVATSYNQLYGVAADAPNDVWAVGSSIDTTSGATAPLTEHYDGSSWSLVTTPPLSSTNYALDGVSVVLGQAFAAGYSTDSSSIGHTLVERYSGGSWSIMTTQDVGTMGSSLNTAVAFSPTNVWVAGTTSSGPGLFEHYDGTSWSVVANGTRTLSDEIVGLGAVPGTMNLWAVGGYQGTTFSPFTEQWQGSVWSPETAAVAPPPSVVSNLLSVTPVSATNAWAVGVGIVPMTGATQSLIEHYGGPPAWLFCP